jgi:hypothetical protein
MGLLQEHPARTVNDLCFHVSPPGSFARESSVHPAGTPVNGISLLKTRVGTAEAIIPPSNRAEYIPCNGFSYYQHLAVSYETLASLLFTTDQAFNTPAQAPALQWAARRLKVTAPAEPLDVKVAPLEALHADLLQTHILSGSRLHGMEIFELRSPAQANVALIVRGGKGFASSPTFDTPEPVSVLLIAATGPGLP